MEEKNKKITFIGVKQMFNNFVRLSKIVWEDKKGTVIILTVLFVLISFTAFFQSGSNALLINELVQIVAGKQVDNNLVFVISIVILASVIPSILHLLEGYVGKMFWFFLEEKFEFILLKKKGEIDISIYEDPRKNDLFNRINENGIWRIRNFIDRQFYVLQGIIKVIVASVVVLTFQWWIFLIILIGTIPDLIVELKYGRNIWSIYQSNAEIKRKYHSFRNHFFGKSRISELKLFQNLGFFLEIINNFFTTFQNEEKKAERKKLALQFVSLGLARLVIIFAMIWFIFDVINGNIQIGTYTFIIASITTLRSSFSGLFMNIGRQYQDSLFVTDVFEFLDIKNVIQKPQKGIILENTTPEIFFNDITFSYPGTKKKILNNFSLKICSGEKLALIGVNGAGKTTLVKLLCRFYDPDSGTIYINGIDLKKIDIESWYSQLGAIFQDYSKYHFFVKEAIAVGRTGKKTSIEKVKDAAKSSEADIFIEEWEDNYEQMLGKEFSGGIEPSTGQWQKLALARAFYRDPKILILDEPTSSIDAEAEAKIFEKLEKLPKDRTIVLISHRFSTVRHADKIAVIENGELSELGSHEELLSNKKTYARLFKIQAKGYR